MSTPTCKNHPSKEAVTTCADCLSLFCSACTVYFGQEELCSGCLPKRKAARARARAIPAVGVLLLATVSVGWWVTRPRPPAPAPQSPKTDHGEYNQVIDSLTEHMQKEPCDRESIVKLIESEPDDKDSWFWRGQVREIQGDRHSAIRDYQQAIALEPRLQGVPLNLVNLLEQAGQPCEALVALDTYMSVYPELRAEPRFLVRLEKLGGNSKCAGFLGTGKAILPRRASDTAILAPVVVNGKPGEGVKGLDPTPRLLRIV